MTTFTPNAIAAEKSALAELQRGSHVKPQLNHLAIVGHSMGGVMAANMAALAATEGLPVPDAICCVAPGNKFRGASSILFPMEDLSKIPAGTLVQVIVGDRDVLVGTDTAKEIFARIKQIPLARKNYIILVSDDHGSPTLIANHQAPMTADEWNVADRQNIGTEQDEAIELSARGDMPALAAVRHALGLPIFGQPPLPSRPGVISVHYRNNLCRY